MTFKDTANYLRSNCPVTATQKPEITNTMLQVSTLDDDKGTEFFQCDEQLNLQDTVVLVQKMIEETSVKHVYNALSSPSLRNQLHIPDLIWKRLEPKLKAKLDEIRREIHKEQKSATFHPANRTSSAKPAPSTTSSIPDQYPAMRQTNHTSALLNGVANMLEDVDDSDVDDDILNVAFMAMTLQDPIDIVVHAHFEYAEVYNDPVKVYGIADGGADSVVLGKHAHVIHETGRYATLVGYDPKHTRSQRIPIVSAYLKVLAHNGIPVFLKVNEAVYYKDNPITLLSEYQIREYGFVIDSVAKKHRKSSTEMGSQRFVLSKHLHVPFDDRGGIMGFEILPILPNDFHNGDPLYDVFEITGAAKWTPSQFCLSPTCLPAHASIPYENKSTTLQVAISNSENLFFYDPSDAAICFPYEAANIVFDPTFVLA